MIGNRLGIRILTAVLVTLAFFPITALAQEETPAPSEQAVTELDVVTDLVLEEEVVVESVAIDDTEPSVLTRVDAWIGEHIVANMAAVLFYPIPVMGIQEPTPDGHTIVHAIPLIVVVLFLGGIFFTFRYGFINIRLFRHSIAVLRGKYDKPGDTGEISHFKALTSALSATVGLGNIAGVAVAISLGGAGAIFWMWLTAFFGMSMKFSSCTFAHLYRRVHDDGRILGGPMVYLEEGITEQNKSLKPLAKVFAIVFAVLTIFAAFGGGNMFQSNQTASIIALLFFDGGDSDALKVGLGLFLATLVGMVIIGGIKRIGEITSKLVPLMCVFYCSICLIIIVMNAGAVPAVISSIFSGAFSAEALYGGFVGVLVQGMKRAAFSNEAGLGSASIAHAAAKTEEPVREGVVAMMGPFIDTIIVCTMTAITILVTGAHQGGSAEGVEITATAFASLGNIAPFALGLAVFVFAFSTIISWGYYGERAVEYLFGERGIVPYRVVYVLIVIAGPMLSLGNVIDFSDMMLLSMAFPNIIGMALISGKVKKLADDYIHRLQSGEMKPVK